MSEIQDLKNHVLALHEKLNSFTLSFQSMSKNNDNVNEILNIIHNLGLERSKQNNTIFENIYPDLIRRLTLLEDTYRNKKTKINQFKIGDYIIAYYGKFRKIGQISNIDENDFISIDKGRLKFHPNQCSYQWE
jgi:hypothetical protein